MRKNVQYPFFRLAAHYEDVTSGGDEGAFKGVKLYPGWIVVGSEVEENGKKKTKKVLWEARSSEDSLNSLHEFLEVLTGRLQSKFEEAVCEGVHDMEVLDIGILISKISHLIELQHMKNANASELRKARTEWETFGSEKFARLFGNLSRIPHVQTLAESNADLNLFPHDSDIVFRRLKSVIRDMLFKNKYRLLEQLFVDEDGKSLTELENSNIVSLIPLIEFSLYQKFKLTLSSGLSVVATLNESYFINQLYMNDTLYQDVGKEGCILYDIVLGSSGCEAVVEGFYSLVKAHKKNGGQSNCNLTKRAVVDWTMPHPIQCPNTIKRIANIYQEGNVDYGVKKHRSNNFFDKRDRSAGKYRISKVVDRLTSQPPKFPYLLDINDI